MSELSPEATRAGGLLPNEDILNAAITIVDFKLARKAMLGLSGEYVPILGRAVHALAHQKQEQLDGLTPEQRDLAVNIARAELNHQNPITL